MKDQKVPLIGQVNQALGMVAISYMAGTILKDEMLRFKRMVFRATRGKALSYFEDLAHEGQKDYAGHSDKQMRTVYVIVF